MISVVTWKWRSTNGPQFGPEYVNKMAAMLRRNLRMEHRVHVITDDPSGIDRDIICLPLPAEFAGTPRCRRRMKMYDRAYASMLGSRILSIDLDVVIVDDITPLVDRPEPLVMWCVGYAGVLSGSFVLYEPGALHGAYAAYAADPIGYPKRAQPGGTGSDQAMLNLYLRESGMGEVVVVTAAMGKSETPRPPLNPRPFLHELTERDGFRTWFGTGYADREHHGMGPSRPGLTAGARLVVLGSADKGVMDRGEHPFVREHWR